MSRLTRNLQLLLRSERVLAEVQLGLLSRKLTLLAGAMIAGFLALGMLNVAGFFALVPSVGSAVAALIVGLVDALLAGLLAAVATSLQAGPEEGMVREVREMAIGELGAEVEEAQEKLAQMGDSMERMKSSVTGFVQSPLEALLPQLVVPTITAVTKLAKAGKKPPGDKD
jgi:hypothetical protein